MLGDSNISGARSGIEIRFAVLLYAAGMIFMVRRDIIHGPYLDNLVPWEAETGNVMSVTGHKIAIEQP
jgi:hypothetical protein